MRRKTTWVALLVAIVAVVAAGCGGSGSGSGSSGKIVVGSKNFTESIVLGEMLKQLIEAKTDLKVEHKSNLGATDITYKAITQGDIDLYAEYDGTIYSSYLKITDPVSDPRKVYDLVNGRLQDELKLKLTKPLGFNNTFTLAVPQAVADKYHLQTYSDLAKVAGELTLGVDHEFMNRQPDGWKGLQERYGFKFKDVKAMDSGLRYTSINQNQIQVTNAFATDGQLKSNNMVILKDDKFFFPPYNAAPIVRMDTLEKYPELEDALNALAGQITDPEMQEMNYLVDDKGESEEKVAKDFLTKKGLI
ncbi:glycine betaine ABC transporter substrate-binding protein [Paenibacillus humicola]|uniref:ABC transporter substrate-binding protein n=1 Tax=Paenibacillus humicola TaxID=3110540 RepID=UPI00237A9DE8|nr:glycine betaine ABC transporter substrate-binding protein [Paenibacillus humicola]